MLAATSDVREFIMLNINNYSLSEIIGNTFIIAYKEDITQLKTTLSREGFSYTVLRQTHQPRYRDYSPSYLCLLNHKEAWLRATYSEQPTLILEADFVPVKGIGQLPIPFDPTNTQAGVAWLYTCAPQVYSVSAQGFAQGFSTSTVAYIIMPSAANQLLELVEQISQNPGPAHYSSWDSKIEKFLREKQFRNYIPFRNYGEHGGKANPEHRQAGLSSVHRADVLYGPLAFIPPYAIAHSHPQFILFLTRVKARMKGIARLLTQKYLRLKVLANSSTPIRLVKFALAKHLTLTL